MHIVYARIKGSACN